MVILYKHRTNRPSGNRTHDHSLQTRALYQTDISAWIHLLARSITFLLLGSHLSFSKYTNSLIRLCTRTVEITAMQRCRGPRTCMGAHEDICARAIFVESDVCIYLMSPTNVLISNATQSISSLCQRQGWDLAIRLVMSLFRLRTHHSGDRYHKNIPSELLRFNSAARRVCSGIIMHSIHGSRHDTLIPNSQCAF